MIPFQSIPYKKILCVVLDVVEVSGDVLKTIVQAMSDRKSKDQPNGKGSKGK